MGDKRKIRTPKVRESFFKPMNLLARFEWKFNQCTYLFNHYLLRGNQIKSREAQIKNLTRKEHGHGKGIPKNFSEFTRHVFWQWQKKSYPFENVKKKIDNDMKKCLPYKSLQMPCSSTEFCQSYNIVKDSNVDLTVGN